jgi:steroid delta-isomerase-like uncharacterized protein
VSVSENLRLVDRGINALNAKDLEGFLGLHAESVVQTSPVAPEPLKGLAATKEVFKGFFAAFPDLHVRKERGLGEGDWVSWQGVITGTQRGPFQGPGGQSVPPTMKSVRIPFSTVAKVENGKFTEVHTYLDQLGMLTQLGLIPPPTGTR